MKVDLHYYGTYALARAAGVPDDDAQILAYAAQYVDDATSDDSKVNPHDGGWLVGFTTAHHLGQCITPNGQDPVYQRKVWVPCHFIPGGAGDDMEQKSLCVKNSPIARAMMQNHIDQAVAGKTFGLELVGIAAHAYMDTFAHYGFSGFGSKFNGIETETLRIHTESDDEYDRLKKKFVLLKNEDESLCLNVLSIFRKLASKGAEVLSGALGHGGVLSFPDRPYLRWEFDFILARPENGKCSKRDNQKDYLEACKELHAFLCDFSRGMYAHSQPRKFEEIQGLIKDILAVEGDDDVRIRAWCNSGLIPSTARYSANEWEDQKKRFHEYATSVEGMKLPAYRFHQAAAYHRYYMLKDLLPQHDIAAH